MNTDTICDTLKLSEDAKAISDLVTKFKNDIYDFYKLFEFLSYNQEIWNGQGARAFYQKTMSEKPQYDEFGDGIKKIAQEMSTYAAKLEEEINNNESLYDDPISSASMINGG